MANPPTTLTLSVKSDADILSDLQNLGLSVSVTSYSSVITQVITFASTPSQTDINMISRYFAGFSDRQII